MTHCFKTDNEKYYTNSRVIKNVEVFKHTTDVSQFLRIELFIFNFNNFRLYYQGTKKVHEVLCIKNQTIFRKHLIPLNNHLRNLPPFPNDIQVFKFRFYRTQCFYRRKIRFIANLFIWRVYLAPRKGDNRLEQCRGNTGGEANTRVPQTTKSY